MELEGGNARRVAVKVSLVWSCNKQQNSPGWSCHQLLALHILSTAEYTGRKAIFCTKKVHAVEKCLWQGLSQGWAGKCK